MVQILKCKKNHTQNVQENKNKNLKLYNNVEHGQKNDILIKIPQNI